jgi:DNA-directed RNA polymerase subunit beta
MPSKEPKKVEKAKKADLEKAAKAAKKPKAEKDQKPKKEVKEKNAKIEKPKKEEKTKETKEIKAEKPKKETKATKKEKAPKVQEAPEVKIAKPKMGKLTEFVIETLDTELIQENAHRVNPNKEKDVARIPNLIETQVNSYSWFLNQGLRELLDEISPISDFSGKKLELHLLEHSIGEAKYDPATCKRKNISYEAPLKVHVQLINKESGEIKEQDVFLGGIPLMTNRGTFVVNGIERVVVSQLVRSPGAFFAENPAVSGMFNAKIIPNRGAWLELETDKNGIISVKIDRKRKIPITSLVRIFGFPTDKEILELFTNEITDPTRDFILNTLEKDPAKTVEEAYQNIYRKIRPGDLATAENAKALIDSMFFDYRKYDLGPVARYKLNKKFNLNTPNTKEFHTFQVKDFIEIIRHLIKLNNNEEIADDIDHLSNRRIRAVGELVQNKFRIGLLRTDRIAKDRMTVMELESITPTQLINSRPITAALREFFASSQLSQFMDQTNPLSELEHKRRLSAMGPGGLSRERASFDVRDVHPSHYGRICPIATPEGPNIGLVLHLATYARVNDYGFIETPFRKVQHNVENKAEKLIGRTISKDIQDKSGKTLFASNTKITKEIAAKLTKTDLKEIPVRAFVVSEITYIAAEDEHKLVIAQSNTEVNEFNEFIDDRVAGRKMGEAIFVDAQDITHVDVSPKQIISVTTSLIPFLEHDDNTRASMGSNMQRQAVSLVSPTAPIVGTGMEQIAAASSGHLIIAEDDGEISYVDANEIVVVYQNGKRISYPVGVYQRSNQATAMHQRVLCIKGQKVKKGDVLADGAATEDGELALGRNLLVAYMAWNGYNFEDAVIMSDRVVKEGFYDSVHIETFTIDVRDTKLGPEIVTRDIPNVSEEKLKDLDEDGIVRIGATVKEGHILVGKITPKGETELTAEERLLRAIFGDKARDVKDSSLKLPGGEGGKVVDVQLLSRKNGDELPTGVSKQIRVSVAQTRKISIGDKVAGRHGNKGVISIIVPQEDMPFLPDGTPVDIILNPLGVSSRMNIGQILETHLGWAALKLGIKIASPALNGIKPEEVKKRLQEAGLPEDGKIQLYDGKTGEPFDRKTTVGVTYIMKLSHLIEDKIHARSVGPYSLVTQQPLGGKAQHGGQRFGEMEVWALEAYGAAHTLQEMLTVKSDDVYGRAKTYEAIVKGEKIKKPRTPESFNVLVKELQSLGLSVNLNVTPEDLVPSAEDNEFYSLDEDPETRLDIDPEVEEVIKKDAVVEETSDIHELESFEDAEEEIDAELEEEQL